MRYGSENAIGGPCVTASVANSNFFGVDVGPESLGCRNGDFSTFGGASGSGDEITGSGKAGMESSGDDVSIVMFLVVTDPSLIV
jgi:hypothetical protein